MCYSLFMTFSFAFARMPQAAKYIIYTVIWLETRIGWWCAFNCRCGLLLWWTLQTSQQSTHKKSKTKEPKTMKHFTCSLFNLAENGFFLRTNCAEKKNVPQSEFQTSNKFNFLCVESIFIVESFCVLVPNDTNDTNITWYSFRV